MGIVEGGFGVLIEPLPAELDQPELVRHHAVSPELAAIVLDDWDIDEERQARIFEGDLSVLSGMQSLLRKDIVVAHVVIARGDRPRFEGVVTEAAKAMIIAATNAA